MMMKSSGKFNLWFNVFILVGMTVAVVLTNIYKLQQPGARHFMLIFASIGALTGVMNTVLSANGNIWTFLFGVIDVSIASIVAFDSSIRPGGEPVWGNFALHAFYFLPMQFVGWWQWRKRGATSKEKVTARRLTASQGALTAGALAIGTVVAYFILCAVSGKESAYGSLRMLILFDAAVFVLNVIGQVLMSLAFMEQWIIWLLVNVFSILLWADKAMSSPDSSYTVVMVIKYSFYLLNSINGLRIWLQLSRKEKKKKNFVYSDFFIYFADYYRSSVL